jgi:predicted acylesterase/phospholipase RssA
VDVNSGNYITYNESEAFTDLPGYVVASASIPFVFPYRIDGGKVLMDGGTVWNTNLVSAVQRCMEIVDDPSKIIMDIIICDSSKIENKPDTGSSIDNYLRFKAIKGYYKSLNDILEFQRSKPTV